jgi:hypothetical protein
MTSTRMGVALPFATTLAAALMCGALALPAMAQDADAGGAPPANQGANGGINTPPPMDPNADQGAIPARPGPQSDDGANQPSDNQPNDNQPGADQPADNQPGQNPVQNNDENRADAGASGNSQASMAGSGMNESALRETGGDTSKPYSAKSRAADNQAEANVTAELNHKQVELNETGSAGLH